MLPKLTIKWTFVPIIITEFLAISILAQPIGAPVINQQNPAVSPILGFNDEWMDFVQPVARVRHSQYSPYNYGGYHSDYYDPYHSYYYWSERYRRQSYRFFKPGVVRRNFSFAFPYGYSPMIPPPYTPNYYGQYPQYMPPQQQQQPQMTKEEMEKEIQQEVTRQVDNVSQAFVLGDYSKAVVRAQEAVKQMPDNTILRFTCSQVLFAGEKYRNAAIAVRSTLEKMARTGQQDVFYPMNLYPDQDTLNKQIEKLVEAVKAPRASRNLHLLLGYQLLGVGRVDEALGHLQKAAQDPANEKAALYLVKVSSRIFYDIEQKTAAQQPEKTEKVEQTGSVKDLSLFAKSSISGSS